MPNPWNVRTTSRFERDARKLIRGKHELAQLIRDAKDILSRDPTNTSRQHDIRKLTGVSPGDGQWHIAIGKYRLRYDISGHDVILYSVQHRKEAY
jgi:mRNA-degrading endonuclease RelE of RelBE toxin-antitoxin system